MHVQGKQGYRVASTRSKAIKENILYMAQYKAYV